MQPMSPRKIYLLCALGVLIGVVLLVWLDGAFMVLASGPIGWSLGVALRTWWKRHGWNPGITVVEDGPAGDASIDDHHE
ncbi:hypothetical protein [Frigoribacterium salinisoli]